MPIQQPGILNQTFGETPHATIPGHQSKSKSQVGVPQNPMIVKPTNVADMIIDQEKKRK